ncbi:MAG: hybrid sensor histidine kinase/response regulator, partial [Symploca sp. SIO2B6]|nr:hybrid sensor histidine kinase/response regulator [Symploca sp. SIO2B6]
MSYNSDVHDQAYQFFIEEVPELLQSIEAGLFALTQDFNHNNIHDVMRAAHSIKGGAAMVELDEIKIIAHRLEDSVRALFSEEVSWDSDLENLLFQGFDCLRSPLLDQLDMGEFDKVSALSNADLVFQNLETRLGDALAQAENYVPSSSDSGFDMVASIFEVDVQQGIERLETVLANPEQFEVAGELRAQAEVFIGFADLFQLPGFGAIAATALVASENHPDNILDVIQLAIEDFRQSREVVLEGDRQQGGIPCLQLIEMAGGIQDALSEPIQTDLLGHNDAVFEGGEIFESGEVFEDGEILESGEVFEDGEIFEGGEVFESGEVFENGEVFEGGEIFENGEVFDDSKVFEKNPTQPDSNLQVTPFMEGVFPLQKEQHSPNASPRKASPPKRLKSARRSSQSPASLSVRVDMDRLERMSNIVSELVINRNSLALQNEGLQRTLQSLVERFENLSEIVQEVQVVRAKMAAILPMDAPVVRQTMSPHAVTSRTTFSNASANTNASADLGHDSVNNAEFDPLEMDRYSVLDEHFQDLLEESAQIEESLGDAELFAKQSTQSLLKQRQMLRQIRDETMWARMFPLGNLLNRFPRMVRELSSTYQKQVSLN